MREIHRRGTANSIVLNRFKMSYVKNCDEWKPLIAMVAIDFVFAIVNILLKKVLDEGMDHLVLVTFRLSIATIFLAPIAYFWERYQ